MKKSNIFIFAMYMCTMPPVAFGATYSRAIPTALAVPDATQKQNAHVSRAATNRANTVAQKSQSVRTRTAQTSKTTPRAAQSQRSIVARSGTDTKSFMDTMRDKQSLVDTCQMQYNECMDNFCNVLDDNQGRCTCSNNIKNYAKTQEALTAATQSLQDVAQKIQYIGLSATEIETLFKQTEAEAAMQGTQDSSQIKSDLDKIKNLIIDVKPGTASYATSGSVDLSGLLDLSIDSSGFDLSALFASNDTTSVSNQRGAQLYKTAAARCRANVLNKCGLVDADKTVVINSYDVAIDKDCLTYERALTDSNKQMSNTVRNTQTVLQKARLLAAQQKNTYDLSGCVGALDACMQSEFVCGDDYVECLDPSGKYIVDGKIVVGSAANQDALLASAWGGETNLTTFINNTLAKDKSAFRLAPKNISQFLQNKIGYHEDSTGRNTGLCISVLNQCQDFTYKDKKYDFQNVVIKEYLARVLPIIKTKQTNILTESASSCIDEVKTCLNNTAVNGQITVRTQSACTSTINTCRALIDDADSTLTNAQWIHEKLNIDVVDVVQCLNYGAYRLNNECVPCPADKYCATGSNDAVDWVACTDGLILDKTNNTCSTLDTIKAEDIARCNAIPGGRVSYTGALCAVWGVSDIDALDAQAEQYGWPKYSSFGPGADPESDYTAKTIDSLTQLYVLRWAYLDTLTLCKSRGGTLDITVGKHHNNAHIYCTITVPAGQMTEEECNAFLNAWPMSSGPHISGGLSNSLTVNGVVKEQQCRYMPAGLYYTGSDLPGQCFPKMIVDPDSDTGNCVCEPGLKQYFNTCVAEDT